MPTIVQNGVIYIPYGLGLLIAR